MDQDRTTTVVSEIRSTCNGSHIIVPKEHLGLRAEVTIFPNFLDCKHYRKRRGVCKTDACVNKKYILNETGEKDLGYLAFASNLPELPKNCKYFEKRIEHEKK